MNPQVPYFCFNDIVSGHLAVQEGTIRYMATILSFLAARALSNPTLSLLLHKAERQICMQSSRHARGPMSQDMRMTSAVSISPKA